MRALQDPSLANAATDPAAASAPASAVLQRLPRATTSHSAAPPEPESALPRAAVDLI